MLIFGKWSSGQTGQLNAILRLVKGGTVGSF